ncbi:MAG: tetratricopeptide repeat protein [Acidobacteria bacterium]|nr:tetratricopeptide repeat protein [Acidobacteriota bacterium]
MKMKLFLPVILLVCAAGAAAQGLEKLADDTFGYLKAGTFGKPKVAKNTTRIALGQVRVHYKIITSAASANGKNAADVTVYLDSDLTTQDLQSLTDEFYRLLAEKLAAAGIEVAPYKDVQATEYYLDRQQKQEDKKPQDYDGGNGQAWVSFSAFDGPVFLRWKPYGTPELIGYGKFKNLTRTSQTVNADLATFDVVVDFAAISMSAAVKQDRKGWLYGDPYFYADYSIGGGMSIPQSYVYMIDGKNNFDQYKSELPIADGAPYAEKPYEDASKTALKTQQYFGGERHSFTPLVLPARRERYLAAARRVLALYADLFVVKLRVLRGGVKPSDNQNTARKPTDNTTLDEVNKKARENNETTAVTTGEMEAAAEDAMKSGKYQLAADYYARLIEERPENADYHLKRSAVFLNYLNQPKEAIKVLDNALKTIADQPSLYYNRGTAYIKTEDWKKARKDFDAAIGLLPTYTEAYLNRGVALIYLKEYDAALADFNRGIELNPRMPNLYRGRALIYKVKGNTVLAQADELRAAQLESGK